VGRPTGEGWGYARDVRDRMLAPLVLARDARADIPDLRVRVLRFADLALADSRRADASSDVRRRLTAGDLTPHTHGWRGMLATGPTGPPKWQVGVRKISAGR